MISLKSKTWLKIHYAKDLLVMLVVFLGCGLSIAYAEYALYFINLLFCLLLPLFFFKKEKFKEIFTSDSGKGILHFSKTTWFFCVVFFAICGWTTSSVLWISLWFIIFRIKKQQIREKHEDVENP